MSADEPTESSNDQSRPSLYKRLRSRRSTRWAMDLFLVALLILAISAFQSRNLLSGDDPLPPVELEALDGTTISLDELDARRTVVYFWTTWCGVCDVQSGAISSLHERAGDNLDVISVVLSYENRQQIVDHVAEKGIDYPVYLGTNAIAHSFNVESYPTVYIIDDAQRIRHGLVGYTTRWGLQARTWF